MKPDQEFAMFSINNDFFEHMFMELQTTAQATYAFHAKSERFLNPKVFEKNFPLNTSMNV